MNRLRYHPPRTPLRNLAKHRETALVSATRQNDANVGR